MREEEVEGGTGGRDRTSNDVENDTTVRCLRRSHRCT